MNKQSNATIRDRYEIGDAVLEELVETSQTQSGAFELAARYARRRGRSIDVYDRMAKHGDVREWSVQPDGHAIAGQVKR